jgi:hypothetical protein
MTGIESAHHRRTWKFALVAVVIVLAVFIGLRLSSTGQSSRSSATTSATCLRVSAALFDGPDPNADSVGYAEAQILPLRQISITDTPLQHAITSLSNAYRTFYRDGGTAPAKTLVRDASKAVDRYCPGATS